MLHCPEWRDIACIVLPQRQGMLRVLSPWLLETFQGRNFRLVHISYRIRAEWQGGTTLFSTNRMGYMCIERVDIWAHERFRGSCGSRVVDRRWRWGRNMMMMLMRFLRTRFVSVGIRWRRSPSIVHDVEQGLRTRSGSPTLERRRLIEGEQAIPVAWTSI